MEESIEGESFCIAHPIVRLCTVHPPVPLNQVLDIPTLLTANAES